MRRWGYHGHHGAAYKLSRTREPAEFLYEMAGVVGGVPDLLRNRHV